MSGFDEGLLLAAFCRSALSDTSAQTTAQKSSDKVKRSERGYSEHKICCSPRQALHEPSEAQRVQSCGLERNGKLKKCESALRVAAASNGQRSAHTHGCDVWLDARKKPQQEREAIIEGLVLAWVQGFLSSKNATGAKGKSVLDVPPPTSIELVMDKICGDNPDWKIYIAADTFATVLIDQYRGGGRK